MNNLLFTSVGRRARLLRDAKASLQDGTRIIATDASSTAPALYCADRAYRVPRIDDPSYLDRILEICRENDVRAVTTLIDPEIELLAANRQRFLSAGILPLCPEGQSARCCFDKWALFQYLTEKGIPTPLTFHSLDAFKEALSQGRIAFPVFIKPRDGSGSVGAHRVDDMQRLEEDWHSGAHDYIIQELMTQGDCDADVYVDAVSHRVVRAFTKRKIETRIGGASKTISFLDPKLFDFIERVVDAFEFSGPLDMDFFIRDGHYELSEINPRFGGAYLHAFGAGVDFFQCIKANMEGRAAVADIGSYPADILMLMYDDVVIRPLADLVPGPVNTL